MHTSGESIALSFFTHNADGQQWHERRPPHRRQRTELHHGNLLGFLLHVHDPGLLLHDTLPGQCRTPRSRDRLGSLSTFGLAWAQNVETLYAMRFLTGMFECCSFTGSIYVIGSWYKPKEIGRRVSLFFIASPLGTMFAGYLYAGF